MADEKEEQLKVSRSAVAVTLAAASLAFAMATFALISGPYTAPFVLVVLLFVWASYYALVSREKMSEMCCMMSGMAFGMMSGFFVGAIAGLATGDFFIGMVIGTVAGVAFGIPLGRLGGPLGRMEGVMAGPMGGIMGSMTGVMVQFFNVGLFMPFLVIVVVLTVWEMIRVIKSDSEKISKNFIYIGVLLSVLAFASTLAGSYELSGAATGLAFAAGEENQLAQAAEPTAPVVNGVQQLTIKVNPIDYDPNYIVLRKDVPVKITLEAAPNAGCTRSVVFPEYKIQKIVPLGGTETVEFTPTKAGTFPFRCSMNMARGTIVVV